VAATKNLVPATKELADPPALAEAVAWAEERGLHPRNVEKSIDRNHIFTHIRWDLRGWFLEVDSMAGDYTWLTLDEIDTQAALPTAFRQFREEI
jgi:A/G-specific adenine glycosylase